jgi:hypothetical protein
LSQFITEEAVNYALRDDALGFLTIRAMKLFEQAESLSSN